MADEFKRMRQMIGNAADYGTNDLILGDGELAIERDTNKMKVGDGAQPFSSLPYLSESQWEVVPGGTSIYNTAQGAVVIGAYTATHTLTVVGGNFSGGFFRGGIPITGEDLGGTVMGGWSATDTPQEGAVIRAQASEDWSAGSYGTDIRFEVTANGTGATYEAMRITGSGNVGIGSTSPSGQLTLNNAGAANYKHLSFQSSGLERFSFQRFSTDPEYGFADRGGSPMLTFRENTGSQHIAFGTTNTERMRITSNGGVLVGLTSGGQGAGTINVSGGYYVNGAPTALQSEVDQLQSDLAAANAQIAALTAAAQANGWTV